MMPYFVAMFYVCNVLLNAIERLPSVWGVLLVEHPRLDPDPVTDPENTVVEARRRRMGPYVRTKSTFTLLGFCTKIDFE